MRSIDEPSLSTQYTGHVTTTTVARFSPSGYYLASGDVSGTVRVWSAEGEHITKGEYHVLAGKINDIAWDGDSSRLIAVGHGKERFGHCLTADSGNTCGEVSGHSQQINSVSIRQQRPLRAATGGDDSSLVFYHGTPFKFNTSFRGQHNRFIYGTAFSPDGSLLVSVGADKKIWLYDGKTGEVRGQIGEGEHKGSIFSVSWAKDSKRFVTSSADQTVKLWDVDVGKATQSWRMGEEGVVSVPNHQVSVVWPGGRSDGLILSLDLAGNLNYLTEGTQQPQRIVQGHQKNITAVNTNIELSTGHTLWTGSSDGRVFYWNVPTGKAESIDGETHTNYVSGIASSPEGRIYSVGWDDKLQSVDSQAKTFLGNSSKTGGQPKGVATIGRQVYVATHTGIEMFTRGDKSGDLKTPFSPLTVAASGNLLAVGGDDNVLHVYSVSSDSLTTSKEIPEASSLITALSFSPDHSMLAAGFSNGKITVYKCQDWTVAISRWSAHTGRITSISWNGSGTYAVSGGLDCNIFVWSVAKPGMRVTVANAHKDGINGVAWTDGDRKVLSVGGDAAVKVWKVEGLS